MSGGASPTAWQTTTAASRWQSRGSRTRRSPNSARRSGSRPISPTPTAASASRWHSKGSTDEAIAEFRAAIRIKPDHASAHYFLGKALAGQGKLDEAIAEIRKARDNAPRGSELAKSIEKALNKLDH